MKLKASFLILKTKDMNNQNTLLRTQFEYCVAMNNFNYRLIEAFDLH